MVDNNISDTLWYALKDSPGTVSWVSRGSILWSSLNHRLLLSLRSSLSDSLGGNLRRGLINRLSVDIERILDERR